MKVFTDFHHASLLNSLILLFEQRLGGEVFRPIGMEWYTEGYWKIYDHPATAAQYLDVGSIPVDGTPPLNELMTTSRNGGLNGVRPIFHCKDIDQTTTNKAIFFKTFFELDIDIVIASIPQHIEPFKRLCELHPNKPKLIYQIGNQWNLDSEQQKLVKNVMASAQVEIPSGINHVIYHQEFATEIFHPNFEKREKKIYSFINCLTEKPRDWDLFLQLEKALPDWEFRSYGGQCRDGAMTGSEALASKMREAAFGFHCKTDGDGYGHVIHNLAATGTPIIVREEDYKGKLAGSLINPYSVKVDDKTIDQIKNNILYNYNEGGFYETCSRVAYESFKNAVDFDREESEIGEFLHHLV